MRGAKLVGLLCASLVAAAACVGAEGPWVDVDGDAHHAQYDGVSIVRENLADLSSQCTFNQTTKVLTLSLSADDQAIVGKSSDDRITINYIQCGDATKANTSRIVVTQNASSPGSQVVFIDYGTGLFALGSSAAPGIDVQLGGEAGDSLRVLGTGSRDVMIVGATGVIVNGDTTRDIAFSGIGELVISSGNGDDSLTARGSAAVGGALSALPVRINGGAGNDTLRGGDGDDTLNGGADNDVFISQATADGGDLFIGGLGIDTLSYSGAPTVNATTNLPSAAGTTGQRTASLTVDLGANGDNDDGLSMEGDEVRNDIEIVYGGTDADVLTGGTGNDTLYGGAGDDTLDGAAGADVLFGDAGDDLFSEGSAASGGDTFNCGAGVDVIDYSGRSAAISASMNGMQNNDGAAGEGDDIKADCDNLKGGSAGNNIVGNALANSLFGGAGADTLSGDDGNDTLLGAGGADVLSGGNGDDLFDEGASASGSDSMSGGAGRDTVHYGARSAEVTVSFSGMATSGAMSENDTVASDIEGAIGGSAGDTLTGTMANEWLEGGAGADTLNGAGGDDVLDGGSGTDTLTCGPGDADVCIDPEGSCDATCEIT